MAVLTLHLKRGVPAILDPEHEIIKIRLTQNLDEFERRVLLLEAQYSLIRHEEKLDSETSSK